MISLISSAAVLVILPHLISRVVIDPKIPPEWVQNGSVYEDTLNLTVTPTGQVTRCVTLSSNGAHDVDQRICEQLRGAQFSPAKNSAGVPVYGNLSLTLTWPDAGVGERRPFADLDVTISQLADAAPRHFIAKLALKVDKEGRVQSCSVDTSTGDESFDLAACKIGTDKIKRQPIKDDAGIAVPSVQSLTVGFGTYEKLISHSGSPGPYFPDRALRTNTGGVTVLNCSANDKGDLSDCIIEDEAPFGFSFGFTGLKMARDGWIKVAPGVPRKVLVRIDYPRSQSR